MNKPEASAEPAADEIIADFEVSLAEPTFADEMAFAEQLTLESQVEALVFAAPQPLKASEIFEVIQKLNPAVQQGEVERALKVLSDEYQNRAGGFRLENLARQGYQFRTVKAASPLMEHLFASRPRPLSRAALETLAIIAYRQPVTRVDIEFVRGVDSGSIIKNLLERDLVVCVGRKEDAGRPMLFGTSDVFLTVFGLSSLSDLPPLAAFQPSPEIIAAAKERPEGEGFDVNMSAILGGHSAESDDDAYEARGPGRAGASRAFSEDE